MFHTRYTLRDTANILYRLGWSMQVPVHRHRQRVPPQTQGSGTDPAAGSFRGEQTSEVNHCVLAYRQDSGMARLGLPGTGLLRTGITPLRGLAQCSR
uniref:hypothetical protein n=1 Tax=Salinispora mooreana TaxID=999545 RepID=UPI001CC6B0D4